MISLIKAAVCVLCVIGILFGIACRNRSDEYKMPASIADIPMEDFVDPRVFLKVSDIGLPAIPYLIEKMKAAPGDIEFTPGRDKKESLRFFIQFCIQRILRQEYVTRNPEYTHVSFLSFDLSLQLLRWWEKEKHNVVAGNEFNLPEIMFKCKSDAEYAADGDYKLSVIIRANEENAEFKRRGYKTINEMLAATGKAEEVDSQE